MANFKASHPRLRVPRGSKVIFRGGLTPEDIRRHQGEDDIERVGQVWDAGPLGRAWVAVEGVGFFLVREDRMRVEIEGSEWERADVD